MLKTLDPPPYGRVHARGLASDCGVPMRNSCHITLEGVDRQRLSLELKKVQDVLRRGANRILTPFTTPASEQEGDLARHLEKQVVPGSPRPLGGDDNGLLRLILSDLDQSPFQKRDGWVTVDG